MGYEFYLGNMLLPVTPSKLSLKINNKNKTYDLINDSEINILKSAGLTDIEFEFLLPNVKYPFSNYKNGFVRASYFLEILEKLKIELKPFQLIVIRKLPNNDSLYNTNMKVSLEEYTIKEDTNNGLDLMVNIKLKQYKEFCTKTCQVTIKQQKPVASITTNRETNNSPEPTTQNKTYTVKKGDCLWNIAKKFYGDGNKYTLIFNANKDKIKNPNLIYPGQVLIIPINGTVSSTSSKTNSKSTSKKVTNKKSNSSITNRTAKKRTPDINNAAISAANLAKNAVSLLGNTQGLTFIKKAMEPITKNKDKLWFNS